MARSIISCLVGFNWEVYKYFPLVFRAVPFLSSTILIGLILENSCSVVMEVERGVVIYTNYSIFCYLEPVFNALIIVIVWFISMSTVLNSDSFERFTSKTE